MYRITTTTATYDIPANWSIGLFGVVYFFKWFSYVMSIPENEIKDMKYGDS